MALWQCTALWVTWRRCCARCSLVRGGMCACVCVGGQGEGGGAGAHPSQHPHGLCYTGR